ncbi:MAG TPA: ABC transporter permease [Tepidisphaeraceae bacterium]|nr:ABC transporter permease [Tepidisphaeraceae bacterium]
MLTYIVRRILLLVPTLLGITILVFAVMAAAPGGIGGPLLTERGAQLGGANAERIREYYNKRYGLDRPYYVQYLRWLNNLSPVGFRANADGTLGSLAVKKPDLGESLTRRRPVSELLADTLPITLLLNLISIPVVYVIGVLTGVIAARNRGKAADVAIGTSQLALWSVPTIWAGVLLIGFLSNKEYVAWFPTGALNRVEALHMPFLPGYDAGGQFQRGYLFDRLWHLVLPVACLSYGGFAFLSKLTRGSILENLNADYVRTARAKGLNERAILYRHVFRNSLLSLITVAAAILPALLGGSVVVETIFGIPGMGKLSVDAVSQRDRELVLGLTFVSGLLGLTSMLIRDVLYAVADPRVTYD